LTYLYNYFNISLSVSNYPSLSKKHDVVNKLDNYYYELKRMLLQLLSDPLSLIAFLLAIVIGLTFHEFAHAWMATRLGDMTAKYAGRLSLNPSKHFDPLGLIFLLLIGFGWGKPVPINPNAFRGKYDEIKVSLAGPFANLIIAFLFTVPIKIAENFGLSYDTNLILAFFKIVAEINVVLAAFNLLPFYPLDGSHIITSLAPASWKNGVETFKRSGITILLIVVFAELIFHVSILSTVIIWVDRVFSAVISVLIVSVIDGIKYLVSFL
jgi:Zn-dependent protease